MDKKNNPVIRVFRRELRRISHNPRYVILLTAGIALAFLFFATAMREGQPEQLPVGVVDMDGTYLSRRVCHEINATQGVHVVEVYNNHTDARRAMQQGKIFAFYEIPSGTYNEVLQFHAPHFGLYSNPAYLLSGTLSYKQLATMGMLAAGAVQREVFRKKGYDEEQIMGLIMPIEFDTHLIGNPMANYQVYLMTTIIPAVIAFIVLLHTIYIIGREREEQTLRNWMRKAGGNPLWAMCGKVLPYFFHYSILLLLANLIMFGPMHFPLEGSWPMMIVNSLLLIFAAISVGIFIGGSLPDASFSMGVGAVYGALSFSISGFSFPIEAMPRIFTPISWLYPIRHYYRTYCDVAIFNNGLHHCWPHLCAMISFGILALIGTYLFGKQFQQQEKEKKAA